MIRKVLLLSATLLLAACETRIVYVERHTLSYVGMDESWLTSCPLIPPPPQDVYDKVTEVQKRDMWTAVYIEQAKQTAAKNKVLDAARKYNRDKLNTSVMTCDGQPCK